MRIITADKIKDVVCELCLKANLKLRPDVLLALKQAYCRETASRVKQLLSVIISNAAIAQTEKLAICQDTGLPVVFLEIGQDILIRGNLKAAVFKGVQLGYKKGCFRNSIIRDPVLRGKPGYAPAVVHTDIIAGSRMKITVLPKGFGCENKSRLNMFNPTVGISEIKKFVIQAVQDAGADACPPYIVGVGIGGTADYACLLAKKALLRKLNSRRYTLNAGLEADLLKQINRLNIGPMGLGGRTTALAVNMETYPTHIAGLPVAVNISCHALRSATGII